MSSLDDLRRRINELDRQILELVGKRQETSREVARAKRATGQATRDYNREREVLLAAREAGKQYGISPQVAENILRLLIRSSLTTQEQASAAAQGTGSGRSALVIGGAGKMGRWFAEFMASQGYRVGGRSASRRFVATRMSRRRRLIMSLIKSLPFAASSSTIAFSFHRDDSFIAASSAASTARCSSI